MSEEREEPLGAFVSRMQAKDEDKPTVSIYENDMRIVQHAFDCPRVSPEQGKCICGAVEMGEGSKFPPRGRWV